MLTLLAVSLNDQPLSQPITARFDGSGGTIGRADHNTMALPDPERHISRLQAEVVMRGATFLIRNVGAANPIVVSGRALAQGETTALAHADQVRIGGYLLQVDTRSLPPEPPAGESTLARALLRSAGQPQPATAPPPAPPAGPPAGPLPPPPMAWAPTANPVPVPRQGAADLAAATPPRSIRPNVPTASPAPAAPSAPGNPFADLLDPPALGLDNPFADLLAPPPARPAAPVQAPPPAADPFADLMPGAAGVPRASAAWSAPAAPAARLPDDFDPFADFAPAPARPGTAATPAAAAAPDPFADLGAGARPASIDAAFGLGPGAADDPLAAFMADLAPPAAAGQPASGLSTDPLQLFGGAAPTPVAAPPQPDQLSALHAAYSPPRPRPVAAPPAPAPVTEPPRLTELAPLARPGAAAGADAAALWAAFCQGAGVALPLPPGVGAEQQMQQLGRILHSAVAGTLQLMAVRASTKHEMRAEMTIIQARSNNPLKFSPDAHTGIEQLVQPPARGFLDGPAAMDDAMHDLVGHSIGTVAGMRAAIEGMLDRFDPAALEAKLGAGGVLDTLLPASRKAKLWDLYLLNHRAIRDEAQEDFHTLFGKAFLAAYEQQVQRLKRTAAAGAAPRPQA